MTTDKTWEELLKPHTTLTPGVKMALARAAQIAAIQNRKQITLNHLREAISDVQKYWGK